MIGGRITTPPSSRGQPALLAIHEVLPAHRFLLLSDFHEVTAFKAPISLFRSQRSFGLTCHRPGSERQFPHHD